MQDICYADRLVFGNIFIHRDDSFVLLNLYSFRRMVLTEEELRILFSCREKSNNGTPFTDAELQLYTRLVSKKQIIPQDTLSLFLAAKSQEHKSRLSKIQPKISKITISPTFACNFNCTYCYQRTFKSKKNFLCPDAIDNICNVLKRINSTDNYLDGITSVTINGGEPLQTQNIETINHIIDCFAKPGINFSLFTNGYNILKFKDRVDFSKFDCIQVSLDNIDPYTSEVNGVNHPISQRVLDGLAYLMQFDRKITISAVFTRELVDNIEEFIRQLAAIGLTDNKNCQIIIAPIVSFGESTLDMSFYSIPDFVAAKKFIKSKKLPSNMGVGTLPETRWISRALRRTPNERIDGRACMCSILKNRSLHFAPNGQLYWCLCVNPEVGNLGSFYPSIEVDEIGIDRCINKSIFSEEKCRTCDFQFLCSSGCHLHSVSATGDYSKPFCGFFFNADFWNNLEGLID